MSSIQIVPHPAEAKIVVSAGSLPELFGEAGRGMFAVMGPGRSAKRVKRRLTVKGSDINALLVNFLERLLFLSDTKNEAYERYVFRQFTHQRLSAEIFGRKISGAKLEIKAVTWAELDIKKTKRGYKTAIVFDI